MKIHFVFDCDLQRKYCNKLYYCLTLKILFPVSFDGSCAITLNKSWTDNMEWSCSLEMS